MIVVAYSGGYAPAAWSAHHGGIGDRLRGIVLFDALYAELDKFAAWIERRESAFFFSAFSRSARDENLALQRMLAERRIDFATALPSRLGPGSVTFLATADEVLHGEFLTKAWVDDPLRTVLAPHPRLPPHSAAEGAQALTRTSTLRERRPRAEPVEARPRTPAVVRQAHHGVGGRVS